MKPNRITDIQSYINKLTLPTIKKELNVTVGYTVQLVTGWSYFVCNYYVLTPFIYLKIYVNWLIDLIIRAMLFPFRLQS